MSAIPTHLGLGPLPDKSYAVSFCLVLRLTVIRNKAGRRGDMAPRCQAEGLMESVPLGIHQLVQELGNPWQRTLIGWSERGGSRPTERSVKPARVERGHPLGRGDLDIINAPPRTLVPDQLGLID